MDAIVGAIQIGTDEHFEVSKALLVSQGHTLYRDIWNDQPALHTSLLAFLFAVTSPSILTARLFALAFGMVMLGALFFSIRETSHFLAAAFGTCLLLLAPETLVLSMSPMLELPAMAGALISYCIIQRNRMKQGNGYIALSAIAFAAALQIKLTAMVAAPALLYTLYQARRAAFGPGNRTLSFGIWITVGLVTYTGLSYAFGNTPSDVLWRSHFSPETRVNAYTSPLFPFLHEGLFRHPDGWIGFAVGVVICCLPRTRRLLAPQLTVPIVWLATAVLVHSFHRPWWPYYYLHFSIPLCWIAGYAFSSLIESRESPLLNDNALRRGKLVSLIFLLGVTTYFGGLRVRDLKLELADRATIAESPILSAIMTFPAIKRSIFTEDTIYAFHADLIPIPFLAVLPQKRFWSNEIDVQTIWKMLSTNKPEQILIRAAFTPPEEGKALLSREYKLLHAGDGLVLYGLECPRIPKEENCK